MYTLCLKKFFGRVQSFPRKNWLDFGFDPDVMVRVGGLRFLGVYYLYYIT